MTEPTTVANETFDPLAARVGWWAIKRGGAEVRFTCQTLVVCGLSRVDFRGTLLAKLFFLPPGILGLGLLALLVWRFDQFDAKDILQVLLLAASLLAWAALYWIAAPPVRFDRKSGYVTRSSIPVLGGRKRVPLADVRALQLLRGLRGSAAGQFPCYELNLVLESGRRLNVAGHGQIDVLRADARRLRAFLQVPLWDAADVEAPSRPA